MPLPILSAIRKQVIIRAVKYGPFPAALDFVSRRTEMLREYLDDSWQLDHFAAAFELAQSSEEKKVCFVISHD